MKSEEIITRIRQACDTIYEKYEGNPLIEKDDILAAFEDIINDYKANELLDKALDFIVETQEQNDYICEQMCEEYVGDYCEKNCQNLNKECVKLFLQKVYNKG